MQKNIFLFIIFMIFFIGCTSSKTPQKSATYHVTIISPLIKINDIGFLHEYKNSKNLQIYSSGLNVANIKIGEKICINSACFTKREFNQKFFKTAYYDEIFLDIITSKAIFNGENVTKTTCGYEQNIRKNVIQYKVCDNETKFIDTQNRVKIILKELK